MKWHYNIAQKNIYGMSFEDKMEQSVHINAKFEMLLSSIAILYVYY